MNKNIEEFIIYLFLIILQMIYNKYNITIAMKHGNTDKNNVIMKDINYNQIAYI